ncbi:FMN-binding negative transcriptional regulator [Stappia sp. ICDLI1TA098]
MYAIEQSRETRREVLLAAIREIGLCTLVTGAGGLAATLVPLAIRERAGGTLSLVGHFARANPHWRGVGAGIEALALFQGPHAYVSPGWYATKRETGKAVPTWAYVAVEARGTLRLIEEPERLRQVLAELTHDRESGRPAAWSLDEAPADYLAALMRGIVGFELEVSTLSGVWKLNQAKPAADRQGTADGLSREPGANARILSGMVRDGLAAAGEE